MITDKNEMTNEELLERYSNLSVDEYKDLLAEVLRLRSGMQDILDDFETTKTDMWSIIKRIQELIE